MDHDAGLAGPVPRTLPVLTDANRAYWTSGQTGTWSLPQCTACRRYVHPGQPWCPWCLTDTLMPAEVSGRGTVFTYTISRYQWMPGWTVPFAGAIVELEEQAGLRVTTNLVDVDPESVYIGMPVDVAFERQGEHWVPLFRPRAKVDQGV
jgi:uncharacterized OB-fold protein